MSLFPGSVPRVALALLAGMTVVLGGFAPGTSLSPGRALALDQTITTCDWASFRSSLDVVMADGGGTVEFDCSGTIVFEEQVAIEGQVTINGNDEVVFDGDDSTRFFEIAQGNSLTLVGVTLQNGRTTGDGGAIYSQGALTAERVTFDGNTASRGGAIASTGTLEILGGTFTANRADDQNTSPLAGGGAIFASNTASIVGATFTDNEADFGGAIANNGTIEILAVRFNENHVSGHGGAIFNNATLTITAGFFDTNSAGYSGGAINNEQLPAVATILASTFNDNRAGSAGGAIRSVAGELDVSASTFERNEATDGGGIFSGDEMLDVSTSTFNENEATNNGGGIYKSQGNLTLTNSTFRNNIAVNVGGAILNLGEAAITANTIVGNNATAGRSGIANEGAMTIAASIIANNGDDGLGENCHSTVGGSISSGGSNLTIMDSCDMSVIPGDLLVVPMIDLMLTSFGFHGGPTPTIQPGGASLAINNADCAHTPETDQRGAPRPATGCDIGAVEVGATVPFQILVYVPAIENPVEGELEPSGYALIFTGPSFSSANLSYDCDGDGEYESTDGCILPDDGEFTIGVQACHSGDPSNCDTTTFTIDVHNLDPTIESITTNAPVTQGQPVNVSVDATDPAGANDPLTYSFDCDGDGSFEIGPQPETTANCALDPAQASATVTVLVADDDGGSTTGSVTVSQTATLCANRYTGALGAPLTSGDCPPATVALTLPDEDPATLCIHAYTGQLTWAPRGACSPVHRVHVVPDDGPLAYCRNSYTNTLRYTPTGACSPVEQAGVIPG